MTNYQVRYGSNAKKHKKKCRNAHIRTHGICCVCMINKSEQVHHSSYRKSGDRYGINIFPVCRNCHKTVCHSPKNWIIDLINPEWKNHNTAEFTARLKRNYQRLRKLKINVKKPS
jgi:hypothetical protein